MRNSAISTPKFLIMKINRLLFVCLTIMLFGSCNSTSPKEKAVIRDDYTINGEISGLDSGWIFLKYTDNKGNTIVDSAAIQNHNFLFSGKKDTPELVTLSLKKSGASVKFFLENAEIKITADTDSFFNAKITGSPAQDEYIEYQYKINPIEREMASLNKELNQRSSSLNENRPETKTASILQQLTTLDSLKKREVIAFIKGHPLSIVSARVIVSNFLWNPEVNLLTDLYTTLDLKVRQSSYGKTIREHLDIAERLAIGKSAPDFSQPDMNGDLFTLSSLRGKFVLINFWASWCGPCRKDNPHLVRTYNEFKNNDFTIVGVSLDHDKKAWIKAVKKDHLDWYQVSDLTGLSNKVMQEYGVWVTPTSYLLDKEGTIIGRNLFGEELKKKLMEVIR